MASRVTPCARTFPLPATLRLGMTRRRSALSQSPWSSRRRSATLREAPVPGSRLDLAWMLRPRPSSCRHQSQSLLKRRRNRWRRGEGGLCKYFVLPRRSYSSLVKSSVGCQMQCVRCQSGVARPCCMIIFACILRSRGHMRRRRKPFT